MAVHPSPIPCHRCGVPWPDHVRDLQAEGYPCIVRCPDPAKWTPRGPDAGECSMIRERAASELAASIVIDHDRAGHDGAGCGCLDAATTIRPAECWEHGRVPDPINLAGCAYPGCGGPDDRSECRHPDPLEGADVDALAVATHAGQYGGWTPADPVAYGELRAVMLAAIDAQRADAGDRWSEALAGGPFAVRATIDSDRAPLYFRLRMARGRLGPTPPAPVTRWTWTTAAEYVAGMARGAREARRLRERDAAVRESIALAAVVAAPDTARAWGATLPPIVAALCPTACPCHTFEPGAFHCPTCR